MELIRSHIIVIHCHCSRSMDSQTSSKMHSPLPTHNIFISPAKDERLWKLIYEIYFKNPRPSQQNGAAQDNFENRCWNDHNLCDIMSATEGCWLQHKGRTLIWVPILRMKTVEMGCSLFRAGETFTWVWFPLSHPGKTLNPLDNSMNENRHNGPLLDWSKSSSRCHYTSPFHTGNES